MMFVRLRTHPMWHVVYDEHWTLCGQLVLLADERLPDTAEIGRPWCPLCRCAQRKPVDAEEGWVNPLERWYVPMRSADDTQT